MVGPTVLHTRTAEERVVSWTIGPRLRFSCATGGLALSEAACPATRTVRSRNREARGMGKNQCGKQICRTAPGWPARKDSDSAGNSLCAGREKQEGSLLHGPAGRLGTLHDPQRTLRPGAAGASASSTTGKLSGRLSARYPTVRISTGGGQPRSRNASSHTPKRHGPKLNPRRNRARSQFVLPLKNSAGPSC